GGPRLRLEADRASPRAGAPRRVRARSLRERDRLVRASDVRSENLRAEPDRAGLGSRRPPLALDRSPRPDTDPRARDGARAQVRATAARVDGRDGEAARARALRVLKILLRP